MRYGDEKNIQRDLHTLIDIHSRQGSLMLLDVIGDSVTATAHKFNLSDVEIERLKKSLLDDLATAMANVANVA